MSDSSRRDHLSQPDVRHAAWQTFAQFVLGLAAILILGGALFVWALGLELHWPWSSEPVASSASSATSSVPGAAAPPAARERGDAAGDGVSSFPRTLTDSAGQSLTLTSPPQRIVSQTLGTDEILLAICPRERLAGLSALAQNRKYSNVTREAEASGIPVANSPEDILRLKPDLVFVASYSRAETVELLRAGGAPVFRFTVFERIDDLFNNVTIVGRATGEDAAAARLIATSRERLAAAGARTKAAGAAPPRVLSLDTSNTTAGANTLFDDVVRHAGATNVAAEKGVQGFGQVSSEQVLAWQPDFLVIGVDEGQEAVGREALARDPAIAGTRAFREGRVIALPNRLFLTTSHHIVETVEAMVDALYRTAARPAGAGAR